MIAVSLPARINIVGSPTDATEGAYATISAAISLRAGATARPASGLEFVRPSGEATAFARLPVRESRGFDIEAAAVNALARHVPEFARLVRRRGVRVQTWTDIPASSGLGGSSVLLLAVLAALRAFYRLDSWRCNDYVLAEITQRAEEREMGIVCGFADRYVPLFGDIAYIGYHGKLWHAPLGKEPFATYERLGARVPPLEFVIATTGVQRNSGAVHAPMRARYLAERENGGGPMLELARRLGATAWRGKIALLSGDRIGFGREISRNQQLIDRMMRVCGFANGVGREARALIRAAIDAGALGAKLTGAGGGGAIFALPPAGGSHRIADALRRTAREQRMQSEVFVTDVCPSGLEIAGRRAASSGRSRAYPANAVSQR
jgi:D-glycero-alpha-D-manno-heptose-7-phosphate kinase